MTFLNSHSEDSSAMDENPNPTPLQWVISLTVIACAAILVFGIIIYADMYPVEFQQMQDSVTQTIEDLTN
jgi:hypothetical protein